ncbi:ribbon-helix-helix domain-containing protein [bacterium]|nr:ribbon-helix-helix domain-containing protein [bacterium]
MPSPNAAPFSLRLPAELLAELDAYAESRGITRSNAIRNAVSKLVGQGAESDIDKRFEALEARIKALET